MTDATAAEATPHLHWLSFADPTAPRGSQFLGAVILRAHDFDDAIKQAWRDGINPGGEVVGTQIPPEYDDMVPASSQRRLLNREESVALMALLDGDGPHD
jgi:hypothetical protein